MAGALIRVDRRTDMTKIIGSFIDRVNAPNNPKSEQPSSSAVNLHAGYKEHYRLLRIVGMQFNNHDLCRTCSELACL